RKLRASRVRARSAQGPGDRRAGPAPLGGAPALPPAEWPLARDERALPPAEVVGRFRGARRVPRPFVPERRRLLRRLGAAAPRVGRRGRPAGPSARASGRRANSHGNRATVYI